MSAALAVLISAVGVGAASAQLPSTSVTLPGTTVTTPTLPTPTTPTLPTPTTPTLPGTTGTTSPTGTTTAPTGTTTAPTGTTSPAPTGTTTSPTGTGTGTGTGGTTAGGTVGGTGNSGGKAGPGGATGSGRAGRHKHRHRHRHAGATYHKPMKPPPPRKPNGVPTNTNPSVTVAPAQPAPLGVPNLLISQFTIPPFLLPIYQACGTEYGIPWNVLAGINKIETGFGTNLNVSTAGAVGWMQFLPSTWKMYGVDANGDGRADPYNPVDAICSAARYLKAAGGDTDIQKAIFAYNHASWYVDEVLLYARQYGGLPDTVLTGLTGLTAGDRFPVAANARYADDVVDRQAAMRAKPRGGVSGNVADVVTSSPTRRGINIYSRDGAPVVAVNDGTIQRIGHSKKLGKFVVLKDSYGNRFTYAQLGKLAKAYPVPKPPRLHDFSLTAANQTSDAPPKDPATAGSSGGGKAAKSGRSAKPAHRDARPVRTAARRGPVNSEDLRPRLFANPTRKANAEKAGVGGQLNNLLSRRFPGYQSVKSYLGGILHMGRHQMELRRLRKGSNVVAGTVLGHIGKVDALAPHVNFSIQPVGAGAPKIDPKPILDGWKLLEDTAIYRAADKNPYKTTSIVQVLLASKQQLQREVLADPRLEIYNCGRRDIRTGQVDQRVLAAMEYFADRGFRLSVTRLKCGTKQSGSSRDAPANGFDIGAINGLPVAGHQGPGTPSAELINTASKLQGVMQPDEVVSATDPSGPVAFRLPGYQDHIHIEFSSMSGGGGYQSPFLDFVWGRIDMGVDFTGTGPILAIGNAKVLKIGAPGWPNGGAGPSGQGVLYQLLDGPRAGQIIYVYEGLTPTVHPGQRVVAGQRIATFYPGSSIEIGFADGSGAPLSHASYYEGKVTGWGKRMYTFLHSLGVKGTGGHAVQQLLSAKQWKKLIGRIANIPNPSVRTEPSKYAVNVHKHG
jgi:Transglycosylase SLT domain